MPRMLQWGRGLSTAEIGLRCPASRQTCGASMGPRSFNRGNAKHLRQKHRKEWTASMGPRSFNRGNIDYESRKRTEAEQLQWGRGLSTAEMSISEDQRGYFISGFNGAAVFQPRK